jgi:putative ABC transport system permease protein
MGESLMISLLGGIIGLFLTYPIVVGLGELIPRGVFPVFEIKTITLVLAASAALIIGIAAAIFPIQRALKTKIIDGFRFVG